LNAPTSSRGRFSLSRRDVIVRKPLLLVSIRRKGALWVGTIQVGRTREGSPDTQRVRALERPPSARRRPGPELSDAPLGTAAARDSRKPASTTSTLPLHHTNNHHPRRESLVRLNRIIYNVPPFGRKWWRGQRKTNQQTTLFPNSRYGESDEPLEKNILCIVGSTGFLHNRFLICATVHTVICPFARYRGRCGRGAVVRHYRRRRRSHDDSVLAVMGRAGG
jgi:hypothetical protein